MSHHSWVPRNPCKGTLHVPSYCLKAWSLCLSTDQQGQDKGTSGLFVCLFVSDFPELEVRTQFASELPYFLWEVVVVAENGKENSANTILAY